MKGVRDLLFGMPCDYEVIYVPELMLGSSTTIFIKKVLLTPSIYSQCIVRPTPLFTAILCIAIYNANTLLSYLERCGSLRVKLGEARAHVRLAQNGRAVRIGIHAHWTCVGGGGGVLRVIA